MQCPINPGLYCAGCVINIGAGDPKGCAINVMAKSLKIIAETLDHGSVNVNTKEG